MELCGVIISTAKIEHVPAILSRRSLGEVGSTELVEGATADPRSDAECGIALAPVFNLIKTELVS